MKFNAGLAVFLAVMVFLPTGCRENPDTSIVVNKDMDKLIDAAQKNDNGVSIAELTNNQGNYCAVLENESLGVKVQVDAVIEVPQTEQMSIIRVRQQAFEQEFLELVKNVLMQDEQLYEGEVLNRKTRSEIEQRIFVYKQELSRLVSQYGDDVKTNIPQEIEKLKKEYETAPSQIRITEPENLSDGKLRQAAATDRQNSNFNGEFFYGINDGGNGKYQSLYMQNNPEYGNCLRYRFSKHGYVYVDGFHVYNHMLEDFSPTVWLAQEEKAGLENAKEYGFLYELGEFGDEAATITLSKAQEEAEQFLNTLGITDFAYYDGGLYCEYQNICYGENGKPEENGYSKIYILQYMRQIDGAFVTNTDISKYYGAWNVEDNTYVEKEWPMELIEVRVNDEGIVGFDYNAPLELAETVVEDVEFKSFDDICSIFEKMILITNARQEGNITIYIDRVVLGYARISEPDSFDTGLLVPVWDFMGRITENGTEKGYTSIMTINAVDGSVIDRTLGY